MVFNKATISVTISHLNSLSLHRCSSDRGNFEWLDMETIFKDIPLSKLTISGRLGALSFPRNLKSLSLDDGGYSTNSIDQVNWRAICRLRELIFLKLDFIAVSICDDAIEFMSKLRSFEGRLRAETSTIERILNPIFSRSSRLTSIEFTAYLYLLYPNFIQYLITTSSILTRLCIKTHHPALCSFGHLMNESTTLSNLTQLTLPWPVSVGKEIGKSIYSVQLYCQVHGGVPEQLTFDHCERFAATFPKLHTIK